MKKMDSKVCVICNTEKGIDNFHKKNRERKQYKSKRSLKRYYENKDETSHQHKIYNEKIEIFLTETKRKKYKL